MEKLTNNFEEKYYGFLFHYYRGEVYRETVWRSRLDVTTNWSIVVTAAILSFVFSNNEVNHAVLIINYIIVWFFLYIESRRFRYYAILRERTKILEQKILSPLFSSETKRYDSDKWLNELAKSLESPKVPMSRIESVSWRLRRNYIFIFPLLFVFWLFRVSSYPEETFNLIEVLGKADIAFIPGIIVFSFMIASLVFAIITAFYISRKYGRDDLP